MQSATTDLFQLLIQAGAVPGEDFSCDAEQQAYHLSERCYDLLQTTFPEIDWRDVLGDPYAGIADRIAQLHEQLGCPFVDQIVEKMRSRLGSLPDSLAAGYLQAVLVGVEGATGLSLYPFLVDGMDLADQARVEWLLRQTAIDIPGSECLLDILTSAGSCEADYELEGSEILLTQAGWQRLALVWNGECTLGAVAESTQAPKHR